MTEYQSFSDEELTAYLDEEYEYVPVDDIEIALKTDTALQARLDNLTIARHEFEASMEQLLAEATQAPEFPHSAAMRDGWLSQIPLKSIAASAILCLGIGWGVGSYMSNDAPQTWREYVAAYQALYINGTLAHIEQSQSDAQDELKRVSLAIDKEIDLTALTHHQQLDYKRAQILGFEGKPLIQLAFLSKTGDPIALCIIRSDNGPDSSNASALKSMEMQGLSSAYWSKGGYEYLLIGGADAALIDQAASDFSARL